MTIEDFKNVAAGIQSLLIGLAVVIGGAWAIYRYWSLREATRADADLKSKVRELRQNSLLNIDLAVHVTEDMPEVGRCITIRVVVENPGNHAEVIIWPKSDLRLHPVVTGPHGELKYGNRLAQPLHWADHYLEGSSIDPNESNSFCFVIAADPGLYRIDFTCSVNVGREEKIKIGQSAGLPVEELELTYEASAFVEVHTGSRQSAA